MAKYLYSPPLYHYVEIDLVLVYERQTSVHIWQDKIVVESGLLKKSWTFKADKKTRELEKQDLREMVDLVRKLRFDL